VPKCSKCNGDAITFIRYNGSHLCANHFSEYVERRFKKEVRKQLTIDGPKKIAVGISGGKDSAVTLELMVGTLGDRRDVDICAMTVDEGILGYRPTTLIKAAEQTKRLGVEHHIVRFKDTVGQTMDDMAGKGGARTPCSYCGVFRRRCLNLKAKELGIDVLATGHNLDDTAQSVLMNFMRGDVERLARLGPHDKVQPGLIPRIEPIRLIPEKESLLYALINDLEFSDDECPYATAALRNEYREIVNSMEDRHPGTRHSIVSSYDAIRQALSMTFPPMTLRTCDCGEPTGNETCMSCTFLNELKKMD
jgi:uncharacterized protein (TIGR00269 family)